MFFTFPVTRKHQNWKRLWILLSNILILQVKEMMLRRDGWLSQSLGWKQWCFHSQEGKNPTLKCSLSRVLSSVLWAVKQLTIFQLGKQRELITGFKYVCYYFKKKYSPDVSTSFENGKRGNELKVQQKRFRLDIRKSVKYCNWLLRNCAISSRELLECGAYPLISGGLCVWPILVAKPNGLLKSCMFCL